MMTWVVQVIVLLVAAYGGYAFGEGVNSRPRAGSMIILPPRSWLSFPALCSVLVSGAVLLAVFKHFHPATNPR